MMIADGRQAVGRMLKEDAAMMEGTKTRGGFLVLFYPSQDVKGRWVAHCLDLDIVGTGDDPEDAFAELLQALRMQIEVWIDAIDNNRKPVRAAKAPDIYWKMAEEAEALPPADISDLQKFLSEEYVSHKHRVLRKFLGGDEIKKCRIRRSMHTPKAARRY